MGSSRGFGHADELYPPLDGHAVGRRGPQLRVIDAAENALRAGGSVGPLELLQHMQLLYPGHVDEWRRGRIKALEEWIQGSPVKLTKTFEIFREWAAARGLTWIKAARISLERHAVRHVACRRGARSGPFA